MTLTIPIIHPGHTQTNNLSELMRFLTERARKREKARATKYYEVRSNCNIKTTKKNAKIKKETPHQKEVNKLKLKNTTQRKKITSLNKKIKALKAEIALMKKTGLFPKNEVIVPGKSDIFNRFAQVNM